MHRREIVNPRGFIPVFGPKTLSRFKQRGYKVAFIVTLKALTPFPDWVSPEERVRLTDTGAGFGPIE